MIPPLPIAILAGGMASRLGSLTEKAPKALLDFEGEPFILHQIRLLKRAGLTRIVLCLGHFGDVIQRDLKDGAALGVNIRYSFDGPTLLGTGGALKRAAALLGDDFFVLYGDSYLPIDYAAVEAAYRRAGKAGLMVVYRNRNAGDRSNVIFRDGAIIRYDKRQPVPEMEHIDYGLGLLSRRAIDHLSDNHPHDLADLYAGLVRKNELAGHEVFENFYEVGSLGGIQRFRDYLRTHPETT